MIKFGVVLKTRAPGDERSFFSLNIHTVLINFISNLVPGVLGLFGQLLPEDSGYEIVLFLGVIAKLLQ